ncbi:limonene 1,2-monooxygenase [Ketogulonicigenium robustum]|uniref:Limonene 1,2-monooxygenase n=1 Tax=Ketogulonicigenium robustum TaxID=92947 RepID=A0A1W6NZ46_9RHOB|nr:putative FMN-dependent luciferase-like monooxygenase [Ketogulonicigenium robustum]ARO14370.1 limonene 1,2-monooxygenase [Ketogulonicigenium robustum]
MTPKRIGYFSRLLDDVTAAQRYQLVAEQVKTAESLGYATAWVAQHHFHKDEGGLPSPFPFLSWLAASTSRIRLATGIITLTMEDPIRVAEDAVVTDILSGGRLEVGFGSGGTPQSYAAFGRQFAERREIYSHNLSTVKAAWAGEDLGGGNRIYPSGAGLLDRAWQATFSADGGARAGADGDGLLLSRTQPRPADNPNASLQDLQMPIVEAYLKALPAGRTPRILASRSVFVADSYEDALYWAQKGLDRYAAWCSATGRNIPTGDYLEQIKTFDMIIGTPDDVAEQLSRDETNDAATEVSIQVHSVDPPQAQILRSLELFATKVAPALGWGTPAATPLRQPA